MCAIQVGADDGRKHVGSFLASARPPSATIFPENENISNAPRPPPDAVRDRVPRRAEHRDASCDRARERNPEEGGYRRGLRADPDGTRRHASAPEAKAES